MRLIEKYLTLAFAAFFSISATAITLEVPAVEGDATAVLRDAVTTASQYSEPITLKLALGEFHLYRRTATPRVYHVSNTASEKEMPDPTKHIGLLFKGMKDFTLDGNGAVFVTHGEMTTFVIDSCENVTLQGFTLRAADPSVPEIRIVSTDSLSFVAEVTPPSDFTIDNGQFRFIGDGWTLPDDGWLPGAQYIAQVFYPEINVTKRAPNPLRHHRDATLISERTVRFTFDKAPKVSPGEIYQLRHSVRNEVCCLINRSKDVTFKDVHFNFLGNFGIVSQFTENITFDAIRCAPDSLSGRTDAGFADFLQVSGCKGLVRIVDSFFEGSHDDPINVHGTHLQVTEVVAPRCVTVRYMHPQTFGIQPFIAGDSIEFVYKNTLLARFGARVESATPIDAYRYSLQIDSELPDFGNIENIVVENTTWTPSVEITGNYFARTPTRAILLTTRRPSVISRNVFYRIPMAAILVSDDARSWYESGPVHNLTISDNTFFECSAPAILIKPELTTFEAPVHRNIIIRNNTFIRQSEPAIEHTASDVIITNNIYQQ